MPLPLRRVPPVPVARRPTFRPRLESLDDRITPAVAFHPAAPFAAGNAPAAMVAGDFNGDGRADVVATNEAANTVSVLLNGTLDEGNASDGVPTFGVAVPFAVGTGPTAVAVGDFDGDGRDDIAVVNQQANSVSVLRNVTPVGAATPTFAAKQDFASGALPTAIAAGDFNGDGRTDIAVSCALTGGVSILKNTSAPYGATVSFAAAITVAVPNQNPQGLTAADLNGDGRTDLAVSLFNGSLVAVLRNTTAVSTTPTATGFDPAITFAAAQTFATGTNPAAVTVGDFDGDGRYDLAVVNQADATVSVLRNTAAANAASFAFAAKVDIPVGTTPRGLAVGDFNGDGRTDFATANGGDGSVSVLENTTVPGAATPTFAPKQDTSVGSAPRGLVAADFDRDGRTDLAVARSGGSTVAILENATASVIGFAATVDVVLEPQQPDTVAWADFDGDGRLDLAVSNYTGSSISVLRNTSAGAGNVAFAPAQTLTADVGTVSVVVGDFDGDGRPDLAVANDTAGTVLVLRNTSTGAGNVAFAPAQTLAGHNYPFAVGVGDFDGDGRSDLAVVNYSSGTVSALRNTSAGAGNVAFAPKQDFAVGGSPNSVAVGDFDGDGRPDLAVVNGFDHTVSVLRNTSSGAGGVTFALAQTLAVAKEPRSVAVGDFDGDGRPDLAVASFTHGDNISVLQNTSVGAGISFAVRRFAPGRVGPGSVSVGDIDGDGMTDLAAVFMFDGPAVSILRNAASVSVTVPAVVVSRGAQGVWVYNRLNNDWRQLLSTAAGAVAVAPNGNVIAVFPGYGTYYYRSSTATWTQLLAVAANAVAIDRLGNAYANFTGYGTYTYAPSGLSLATPANGWVPLPGTNAQADKLVVSANGDVVANFVYAGVWRYRPTVGWTLLNGVTAAALAVGDNGQVVVTFTAVATGVYRWRDGPNPGWALLHGYNATGLAVDGNGNVAATFNSPTLPGGVQVARSRASATGDNIDWLTIHQGTAATSIAMDLFGNALFDLNGYGVYEYSVYPGYKRRGTFEIAAASIGR